MRTLLVGRELVEVVELDATSAASPASVSVGISRSVIT